MKPSSDAGITAQPKHFVFVPGSFHGAWCWYKMQPLLNQNGHTSEAVDLPGYGLDCTLPASITLDDYVKKAVTYELQKKMVERIPVDKTFEMATSHSPFLSQPGKLAQILLSL